MERDTKQSFRTDTGSTVRVHGPLTLEKQDQRRFVRLEIISEVLLKRVKDIFGRYDAAGSREVMATILNLSVGGVLVDLSEPLNEGDIVALRFTASDVEPLDSVLGLVKRCDTDEEGHLAGIQFVNREQLEDFLSGAELELLDSRFGDFQQVVGRVLERYIYEERN